MTIKQIKQTEEYKNLKLKGKSKLRKNELIEKLIGSESIINILTDVVKESGISDIIINMKNDMEMKKLTIRQFVNKLKKLHKQLDHLSYKYDFVHHKYIKNAAKLKNFKKPEDLYKYDFESVITIFYDDPEDEKKNKKIIDKYTKIIIKSKLFKIKDIETEKLNEDLIFKLEPNIILI